VVEVSLSSVSNIIAATTTEKYTELAKAFSLKKVGLIGKTSLNAKLFT
jgi:hypothetical protein